MQVDKNQEKSCRPCVLYFTCVESPFSMAVCSCFIIFSFLKCIALKAALLPRVRGVGGPELPPDTALIRRNFSGNLKLNRGMKLLLLDLVDIWSTYKNTLNIYHLNIFMNSFPHSQMSD